MKEGTYKSVECKASNANPSSSVDMEFLIDEKKQKYQKRQETVIPGPHNGTRNTFTFIFTTTRSQNEKPAKCKLQWDGKYIKMVAEDILNITCKQQCLDDRLQLDF